MKAWIASIVLVAALFSPAIAQNAAEPDPEKIALASQILEETHAADNMSRILDSMIPLLSATIKQASPQTSDDVIKLASGMVLEEMRKDIPTMLSIQARIFAEHFTLDEMKSIGEFYKTPAGQKAISELPAIAKETLPLGMAWGKHAAEAALPRVIEKLRAQGVKI